MFIFDKDYKHINIVRHFDGSDEMVVYNNNYLLKKENDHYVFIVYGNEEGLCATKTIYFFDKILTINISDIGNDKFENYAIKIEFINGNGCNTKVYKMERLTLSDADKISNFITSNMF